MRKFILKITVCLALLICCFPTVIYATPEASLNDVPYATLKQAVNDAQNGDTVKLLRDITIAGENYDDLIIIADKSITLDGDGFNITYLGSGPGKYPLYIWIDKEYTVTIKNLFIYAEKAEAGVAVTKNGTLNLENVTVSGGSGEGVPYRALFLGAGTSNGNVNITGCHLEGNYGMFIFGEQMIINVQSSDIISKDTSDTKNFAAIILNGYDNGYHTNDTVVNVTGGSVEAYKKDSTPSHAVINASITGKVNFNGTSIIGDVVYPVAIAAEDSGNYDYHYSLQDAIDAVVGTDKYVNVLRDINIDSQINISGKVTINGCGRTLTSSADNAILIETSTNDTINIKDYEIIGKPEKVGIKILNGHAILKLNNVTVSVEKGCAVYVDAPFATLFPKNSNLSGLRAIALRSRSGVQITDTKLTGTSEQPDSGIGYGVIDIAASDVNVIVYGGSISATTQADKENLAAIYVDSGSKNVKVTINVETEIQLNGTATIVDIDPTDTPLIGVGKQYKQQLNNEGYGVTEPNSNDIVFIDYEITVFEVTYMAEGTTVAVIGVQNGEHVANVPEVPAKEGYNGTWDHDGKNITEDMTINAVYVEAPVPDTGDNSLDFWTKIMLISGLGVLITFAYGRKKKLI